MRKLLPDHRLQSSSAPLCQPLSNTLFKTSKTLFRVRFTLLFLLHSLPSSSPKFCSTEQILFTSFAHGLINGNILSGKSLLLQERCAMQATYVIRAKLNVHYAMSVTQRRSLANGCNVLLAVCAIAAECRERILVLASVNQPDDLHGGADVPLAIRLSRKSNNSFALLIR